MEDKEKFALTSTQISSVKDILAVSQWQEKSRTHEQPTAKESLEKDDGGSYSGVSAPYKPPTRKVEIL
ncbi:hypothetical protein KSD_74990 [Ktedonobacter sp. SOSP1-85]|nr:hypothetical protein KSD_74990 [Ktedonobacter sp. SOSP1-85]